VWAYHIRERRQEPTSSFPPEILAGVPGIGAWVDAMRRGEAVPAPQAPELIPWFREGARQLEEAARSTQPDEPVWHWSGDARARTHYRMMAFETAVHRWDAESARSDPQPVTTALAADGIAQTFEVMLPMRRRANQAPAGSGERYRFVPTDIDESWLVRFDPEDVTVRTEAGEADVTVRATASDLFLFLWQRMPAERLTVEGDTKLLDRYFELVPPI
jgi:uncharacterized protein (TIGR03083 family)